MLSLIYGSGLFLLDLWIHAFLKLLEDLLYRKLSASNSLLKSSTHRISLTSSSGSNGVAIEAELQVRVQEASMRLAPELKRTTTDRHHHKNN